MGYLAEERFTAQTDAIVDVMLLTKHVAIIKARASTTTPKMRSAIDSCTREDVTKHIIHQCRSGAMHTLNASWREHT